MSLLLVTQIPSLNTIFRKLRHLETEALYMLAEAPEWMSEGSDYADTFKIDSKRDRQPKVISMRPHFK